MPGYQWFGRGILTRTGGLNAQGPVASSSGISSVSGFTVTAGGYDEPITQSSSGVTLVAYGTHVFTTAADASYYLANPTQGVPIHFCGTVATGSTHSIFPLSTDVLFTSSSGGTNGRKLMLAGTAGASVMCTSSGKLAVIGSYGTVVVSSST